MFKERSMIAVFGLGHMGLPTATLFAKNGLKVVGIDINRELVDQVNSGISPIMEPDLDELVKNAVNSGNLQATVNGIEAARNADVMMVIVPTPVDENKYADISAVINACETISKSLNKDDLVIIESTVPPGTSEDVVLPILDKSGLVAGSDFYLACTPERALPNNTIHEITHNARVIGGVNSKSAFMAAELYSKITSGDIIRVKNLITAEMVKLMENTYRDTNIALANELAIVCESLGVDAIEAIKSANHHPRVNIHTPGPGVGGHCLSIDPYFILEIAQKEGLDTPLIRAARRVNEDMPQHVDALIEEALEEVSKSIAGSTIGVLGVAYKGDVADYRESPSQPLIRILKEQGAMVYVHDPFVPKHIIESFNGIPVTLDNALDCDCVVIVTDHSLYKNISPEMIKNGVLVCTRPLLNPEEFKSKGVIFKGIGLS